MDIFINVILITVIGVTSESVKYCIKQKVIINAHVPSIQIREIAISHNYIDVIISEINGIFFSEAQYYVT